MSKQSLISDEIDVDRKEALLASSSSSAVTSPNVGPSSAPGGATTTISSSGGGGGGGGGRRRSSSDPSQHVENNTTEIIPNYTDMPEYENPRATLRLSSIKETTQDFHFEPFDPTAPDANPILKCLCRISIIEQILTNYGFKAVAALSSVYFV